MFGHTREFLLKCFHSNPIYVIFKTNKDLPVQNQTSSLLTKMERCNTPKFPEYINTCVGPNVSCNRISHSFLSKDNENLLLKRQSSLKF